MSKKIGFSLSSSKSKKRKLNPTAVSGFTTAKTTNAPSKQFVVGFEKTGKLQTLEPTKDPEELVISLIKTNKYAQDPSIEQKETPLNEDEQAAQAVLDELRQDQQDQSNNDTLVIPMASTESNDPVLESKRKELFPSTNDVSKKPKAAPLLAVNQIPGIEKLENEKDKFLHDISLRPEEVSVHSDRYEAVPVASFGAAMLRGMGWSGKLDKDEKDDQVQPRIHRLGLGATPRPPSPEDEKTKKRRKQRERPHQHKSRHGERHRRREDDRHRRKRDDRRRDDRDRDGSRHRRDEDRYRKC